MKKTQQGDCLSLGKLTRIFTGPAPPAGVLGALFLVPELGSRPGRFHRVPPTFSPLSQRRCLPCAPRPMASAHRPPSLLDAKPVPEYRIMVPTSRLLVRLDAAELWR